MAERNDMLSADRQSPENLICIICDSYYSLPKILQCGHTFCEDCLRCYVVSRHYDVMGKFPCPTCQQEVVIPEKGMMALRSNDQVNHTLHAMRQRGHITEPTPRPEEGRLYPDLAAEIHDNRTSLQPTAPPTTGGASSPTLNNNSPDNYSNLSPVQLSHNDTVTGNPIHTDYYKSIITFGKFGSGLCDFTQPYGICVVGKNSRSPLLYISDRRENRVLCFNMEGQVQSVFMCPGEIYDITADKKDLLYIVNAKAGRALAVCYTVKGKRVSTYGNMFTYENPRSVSVNAIGNVIVSCDQSYRCYIMNPQGKMIHEFGGKGAGGDRFLKPWHLTSNSNCDIIVSDTESNCVKVFDKNGKAKFTAGSYGCNDGELHNPLGVTCDQFDNIIVADAGNNRIQVFDAKGKFKSVFLSNIDQVHGFGGDGEVVPRGLCVVGGDRLAVLFTGSGVGEVRVYRYPGSSASKACVCQ